MNIQQWENREIDGSLFNEFNYDQGSLDSKDYPYAMVCFVIDNNTMIVAGSDPLSPKDFMKKINNKKLKIDKSIKPRHMATLQGKKAVYYAKLI